MKPRAFGISQIQTRQLYLTTLSLTPLGLFNDCSDYIWWSGARIFLRHLNFVDRRFLYFARTNFCDFERLFFFRNEYQILRS